MNNKTKNMVGIGLFTAIVVVLQFLGGGIKFGMFSISLVLVPIVVGAAVYGWAAGGWLGFAFGAAVLLSGDAAAFLAVDPLATVAVVLVKGIICGMTAGLLYMLFGKLNKTVGVFAADGVTIIDDIHYIQRGYEDFEAKLQSLGAQIEKVESEREVQKFKLKVG